MNPEQDLRVAIPSAQEDSDSMISSQEYQTPLESPMASPMSTAEQLAIDQKQLRQRILEIQKDASIQPADKARCIQQLMTVGWTKYQGLSTMQSEDTVMEDLEGLLSESDKAPTFHSEFTKTLGCKHYQRNVKIQADCCKKWFTCRFCHDEASNHEINRKATKNMLCMKCCTVQPAGKTCISCSADTAHYYCDVCKFWDNDARGKSIFHCSDCGICRVGKGLGQDYFHCQKCNICLAMSMKGKHKCIERNLESDCPICGEFMFTSISTVIFMVCHYCDNKQPCGHCIHYKCHQDYIQTSYQCPTCFKSLTDMTDYFKRIDSLLDSHQMPPEYQNTQSLVYCNDCETKSLSKYHFLYHKCQNCSGYNTKVLQTIDNKAVVDTPQNASKIPQAGTNAASTSTSALSDGSTVSSSAGILSILGSADGVEASALSGSENGRRGFGASGPSHF